MTRSRALLIAATLLLGACETVQDKKPVPITAGIPPDVDARIAKIHESFVFADMHAHPSRFHRANVEKISAKEVALYRSRHMDLVVANISSDMAYRGNYFNRDGSKVEKGEYKPAPGETFALTADRMQRLQLTFDQGIAVHADHPQTVMKTRRDATLAVIPALEGADALEGDIQNLHKLHDMGLRLIQLVHFRNNELGHIQTFPFSPGGLTPFGKEVVRVANRLGLIIDLAHCNTETIMDVLALSKDPVIFSHGGLKALLDQDRALSDDEVRAIAAGGGIVGIWPHGKYIPNVAVMVDFIEHIVEIAGADHVGIGSDLRGMSAYADGFAREAEFRAIAMELLNRSHSNEVVGKIMGGNFYELWQSVAAN
ncbi:MAG: dipeptidase [Gammaproteobacteria bacterium]|nr:dipeptidase [Gammaproteobacteria bacterium]